MKTEERRFLVYNHTDGVLAWPLMMTLMEAKAFVQRFPQRFRQQGCYWTASGQEMPSECVELTSVNESMKPVPLDEEELCELRRQQTGGPLVAGEPPRRR